jgi:uncharacterized membrane protein YjjB (DUF3815 family)
MAAQFTPGQVPRPGNVQSLQRAQVATGVTLLQPGSLAFRLIDYFQKFDPSLLTNNELRVTTALSRQLSAALEAQYGSQIAALEQRLAAAGIP